MHIKHNVTEILGFAHKEEMSLSLSRESSNCYRNECKTWKFGYEFEYELNVKMLGKNIRGGTILFHQTEL